MARVVRDLGMAEDLAQDALVAALEQWPSSGVPENPGAWLMAVGKRRAIDLLRRKTRRDRKYDELGRELEMHHVVAAVNQGAAPGNDIGDDLLRLIFTCCHPVLSTEARVALTLRLLGGLTTEEIARAFLVSEPTVAQRVVRAKRTLTAARVPFEVPRGGDRTARLSSVLEVIYLVFNEGYSATAAEDWVRPALCEDALIVAAGPSGSWKPIRRTTVPLSRCSHARISPRAKSRRWWRETAGRTRLLRCAVHPAHERPGR